MIYSIIPAQYLYTNEFCFLQILSCMFFLNKIRDELTEKLENVETDLQAVNIAKHINDLTLMLEDCDNFNDRIDDFINYDLFNILFKKRLYKNTIWYKEVDETNDGFLIKDICRNTINEYKLEMCMFLNKNFDLKLVPDLKILDGTLNY